MSAPAAADSHPSRRAKALTDIAIQKLKPREQRYEVGDPGARGLRVVVQPSGTKSYILRYRFGGKPEKFTIGSILIGLAAARAEASKAIYEITQGRDPAAAKRASKEEQKLATLALVDTFRSVAQRYLKIEGSKLRSAETFRKTLERLVFDTLGDRAIADIKRSEIVSLLDRIETERGPAAAHAALAIVRRIMNWHAVRSDNFRTPIVKGMARVSVKERARTRVLTDDEIRQVWRAAAFAGPFGRLIQFLLLTGARLREASNMRFAELTGSDWLLPAERNKTKSPLLRPLSAAALEVIAKTPRTSDMFVFCADGVHPLSGHARPKKQLDAASGVTGWRLHDLRRTARSLMSRAGVPSDHAERCLGHILPGIRGIYDRHEYLNEKRRAYEALEALLERIVNPPTDNIVAMRG